MDDRIERLERRIDELEDRRSPLERSRSAMDTVIPSETRRHLRAAGREQLLAVRSLLDYWINGLRDEGAATDKPESSRENIRID